MRQLLGIIAIVLAVSGCHRTSPQSPSQRSSGTPQSDSTLIALMEVNRRMASEADKLLLHMADSLTRTTGVVYAQMSCGGWKSKRTPEERDKAMYAKTPGRQEKWRVRIRTFHLDGRLATDTESEYAVRRYELPIVVEEAIEDMHSGEHTTVLSPWYCAYGVHGNDFIAPYENVIIEVILGECTFAPFPDK